MRRQKAGRSPAPGLSQPVISHFFRPQGGGVPRSPTVQPAQLSRTIAAENDEPSKKKRKKHHESEGNGVCISEPLGKSKKCTYGKAQLSVCLLEETVMLGWREQTTKKEANCLVKGVMDSVREEMSHTFQSFRSLLLYLKNPLPRTSSGTLVAGA